MSQLLTERQVRDELQKRLEKAGTLIDLGADLNPNRPVSAGYLNDVLKGRKRPGPRILKPLGLELERGDVLYRRVRPVAKG